jgi:hypothetical protein
VKRVKKSYFHHQKRETETIKQRDDANTELVTLFNSILRDYRVNTLINRTSIRLEPARWR